MTQLTQFVEKALPWLGGLLGLCFFHRYTIHSGFDLVQADTGDSRFIVFTLESLSQTLRGRWPWLSPPIFYPVKNVAAYTDLMLGPGLLHAAIRSFIPQPFVAFNLTLVTLSLLSYIAAFWLTRRVLGVSSPAAVAGGLFFAFSYPKAAQLGHPQLRFDFLLPVIFGLYWKLLRDADAQTPSCAARRVAAIVCLFVLQAASSFYNAWFFALFLLVFSGYALATRPVRQRVRSLLAARPAPLVGALAVSALLCIPLVRVYQPVMGATGGRTWSEVSENLPRLADLLWQGEESYVWGGLFCRFRDRVAENWTERRIGFGLVSSALIAAATVWALSRMASLIRSEHKPRTEATAIGELDSVLVPVLLVSALTLAALAVRWPSGSSAWEWVYRWVPLASGIRAVPRIFLVLSLPIAVSLAWILDRCRRAAGAATPSWKRSALRVCVGGLVTLILLEQCGRSCRYSGRQAYGLANQVAALVEPSCSSFYLMPTPAMRAPVLTADRFDAAKYLEANPDLAKDWGRAPWEHYDKFGRSEGRSLSKEAAQAHENLVLHYNLTAAWVALITGIPTVNGYSGLEPPGYRLSDGFVPDIEQRIDKWVQKYGIRRPWVVEKELSESDIRTQARKTYLVECPFEGSLDLVDGNTIAGWAWNSSRPNNRAAVDIYDGDTLLGTVPAEQFRQDLVEAKIGDGGHGFFWSTPASLKDGKPHSVRAKVSGTYFELDGSPMQFTFVVQ